MEFNQKLQELRKQKGLTQEELARKLYVSRAAISKWESGRGYPNIDSLKDIAELFSVTVDELLSPNEIIKAAKEESKQKENNFCDLIYGLLDISFLMLLFLPLFAEKGVDGMFRGVSLLALDGVSPYLKIAYFSTVIVTALIGILTLVLQNCQSAPWLKIKTITSLILGVISSLLFIVSNAPYAAVFTFVLLIIKALLLIKRK